MREILAHIAQLVGRKPAARAAALRGGSADRLFGGGVRPSHGPQRAHHLGRRAHVAQAHVLLERQGGARIGLSMAPAGQAFEDAVRWFREQGLLQDS